MFVWLSEGLVTALDSLASKDLHLLLDILQYFPLIFSLFLYASH